MKVICVDDHPEDNVNGFLKSQEAYDHAVKYGCDVLLCEINLYKNNGLLLAQKIKAMFPDVKIIFVTVCDKVEHADAVKKLNPFGYLTKPITREQIVKEFESLNNKLN